MRKKICGIYKIFCEGNGKVYIGQSVDITHRWSQHIYRLKIQHHCNNILQNAWNFYGKDSFKFEIVEELEINKTELDSREVYWIEYYKSHESGFNVAIAPTNGMFGRKHSEESKKKMSESNYKTPRIITEAEREKQSQRMMGKQLFLGGRQTDEAKKKISEAGKGRVLSEETKQRISDGKKGKRMKQEAIDKMRMTKTGIKQSDEVVKKRVESILALHRHISIDNIEKIKLAKMELIKKIMCIDSDNGIYTYSSVMECADILGIPNSSIRGVLCGKAKTAKGFRFLYLN